MAPAPAAKKSRPRESRSTTTTASSVKGAKKNAAAWLDSEQTVANAQGWAVYECVDEKTLQVFYEVMAFGDRFTDQQARAFVDHLSSRGDKLGMRAHKLVFASKLGQARKKK